MGEESILSSIFKKMCKNVSFLTLPYSCVDGGIQLVRSHFGGRGGGGLSKCKHMRPGGGGGGGGGGGLRPVALLKKRLWYRCFPAKISRNFFEHLFCKEHIWRLFLDLLEFAEFK